MLPGSSPFERADCWLIAVLPDVLVNSVFSAGFIVADTAAVIEGEASKFDWLAGGVAVRIAS